MSAADERGDTVPAVGTEAGALAPAGAEGFRLGGEPPQVMRLSRRTLAIIGGVAATAIGGSLLWALQPPGEAAPPNLYEGETRGRPDTLARAPGDYGSVPKLGPPLPGDLGRPIVAAQRQGEAVPVPAMAPPASGGPSPEEQARERAEQERNAARSSRLFLGGAAASLSAPAPGTAEAGAPAPGAAMAGTISADARRRAFLASGPAKPFESPERVRDVTSPNVLQAGSIIPAALITGIRSDLPGQVTAQVTQNVYDSPTGRILLVPQGARLVGEYDSEITAGQERVLLAWDRLILPGGRSIGLGREPGTDAAGRAGLSDRTDHHWGRMLRAALVSSLLGVGAEIGADNEDRLVRALRGGPQDAAADTGRQIVERELRAPPTLTIRPGFALRVLVTRDLVVEPAGEAR